MAFPLLLGLTTCTQAPGPLHLFFPLPGMLFLPGVCKVGFLASCGSHIKYHLLNEGSLTSTLKIAHHPPCQCSPSPPALFSSMHSHPCDVFVFYFLHILALSSRRNVSPVGAVLSADTWDMLGTHRAFVEGRMSGREERTEGGRQNGRKEGRKENEEILRKVTRFSALQDFSEPSLHECTY